MTKIVIIFRDYRSFKIYYFYNLLIYLNIYFLIYFKFLARIVLILVVMKTKNNIENEFKKIYQKLQTITIGETQTLEWLEMLASETGATVHRALRKEKNHEQIRNN